MFTRIALGFKITTFLEPDLTCRRFIERGFHIIAGGEKKVRFFYASKFFTTNSEAFTAKDKEQALKNYKSGAGEVSAVGPD